MSTKNFDLATLVFGLLIKNFNIGHNFWMVCTRALIFQLSISCDKTFLWVPKVLTLWPWPWCLMCLLKMLSLAITFEWYVLGLLYFTWVFLVTKPFHRYQNFWSCDLDLGVWPTYKNINLGYNFWMYVLRLRYFTWVFLLTRPFCGYQQIWPCDLDLCVCPTFPYYKRFPWHMINFCNVATVMEQVIWHCDLSIWPTSRKL
jgi:hypothetical protein